MKSSDIKAFWKSQPHIPPWLPDWRFSDEYTPGALKERDWEILTSDSSGVLQLVEKEVDITKQVYGWEFLRRNPKYQSAYAAISELCSKESVEEYYLKPLGINLHSGLFWQEEVSVKDTDGHDTIHIANDDTSPVSMAVHLELARTLKTWGLSYYLLNPEISHRDMLDLTAVGRLGPFSPAVEWTRIPVTLPDGTDRVEEIPLDTGIIPDGCEETWLFDASLPIAPQINRVKAYLEEQQKLVTDGRLMVAPKYEISKFNIYLRLLDADASGATNKEIQKVLYPTLPTFDYTEKSHTSPSRNILNDHRKAAYYLCQQGYKLLLN